MPVKNRAKRRPASEFEKKLFRYALAGGAALGIPAISHAGVITTVENQTISTSGPNASFAVDFDADGVTDFTLSATAGTFLISGYPSAGIYASGPLDKTYFIGSGPKAAALTSGDDALSANSSTSFTTGGVLAKVKTTDTGPAYKGNWDYTGTNPAFLGVKFDISGVPHLGWAEISTTVTDVQETPAGVVLDAVTGPQASATLMEIGYDTTPFSDVPEPSSLALFALGAIGIVVLKRRKKAAA